MSFLLSMTIGRDNRRAALAFAREDRMAEVRDLERRRVEALERIARNCCQKTPGNALCVSTEV